MIAEVSAEASGLEGSGHDPIGRLDISTVPFSANLVVRSATYTPSGKVLVSYAEKGDLDPRHVKLAIIDDDGSNMRPIFSQALPVREKDNGIRFMVFADNKRIFLGDFVIECASSIDTCAQSHLYPVIYPEEVASGDHISHRWSEIIVAPDNRHIAWTTLLANYSSIVFLGELRKEGAVYRIIAPQIISTLDPFTKDPAHPDGVLPQPVKGGEVKQFVDGGRAISLVGAGHRDLPTSVVQDLATGRSEAITDTPGYNETTIFSPDERLGITMTTRFSQNTDLAILGLMPRPYPDSLNMGLSMFAYTYAVTGVRRAREGDIGPALIDLRTSKAKEGSQGVNLSTQEDWVFYSPMSWAPSGTKAMWIEGQRGSDRLRIQVVRLPGYQPAATAASKPVPHDIPYASSDLSMVAAFAKASQDMDVKIYGRKSGYITYRHRPDGVIEKTYANFSDDGQSVYSGSERMEVNPRGRSTYMANVKLSGTKTGIMDLRITFGPLSGRSPAEIISEADQTGAPLSRGYVQYAGQNLNVQTLLP